MKYTLMNGEQELLEFEANDSDRVGIKVLIKL